jgi:membrane-associated HD superfamily phosphohydrolase
MRYDKEDGRIFGKMNSWLIIGVLALYIVLLFICAFFGEKHASRLSTRGRMLLFSLTLGSTVRLGPFMVQQVRRFVKIIFLTDLLFGATTFRRTGL